MDHKIGYIQTMSGCLSIEHQRQEVIEYGVHPDNLHTSLEGIVRAGEFHEPNDILVVYDVGIISIKDIDDVMLNIAEGGSKGLYEIKTKKLYRAALPYAQDRVDLRNRIKGADYKGRSKAAEGKAGAKPALEPDQVAKAKALAADGMKPEDIAYKMINRRTKKRVSASTIRRVIK